MEYRILNTAKGTKYMKGNRFCKATDIPEDVLQRLHTQQSVDTSRDCPFCGAVGTEEKTLNSVRYYLCAEDYQTRTTGELAEAVRTIDLNNN